jgi:hypothetical protein
MNFFQSCFKPICLVTNASVYIQIMKLFHASLKVDSVDCVDRRLFPVFQAAQIGVDTLASFQISFSVCFNAALK